MQYIGRMFRPPSEADSLIIQATTGCSWNACTYCDMYGEKTFSVKPVDNILNDIAVARRHAGDRVRKIFVADGDALVMDPDHWLAILQACYAAFPLLKRVSCYATAINLNEKSDNELAQLRNAGLRLLYVGPETGDDLLFKRIAKGADRQSHVIAAQKARNAGLDLSIIFLLGAGGEEHSDRHARSSASLASEMNPRFLSLLTLTVIPGTPIAKQQQRGSFVLPSPMQMLQETRTFIAEVDLDRTLFRTNHASNYLPLGGWLNRDQGRLLRLLDQALNGEFNLKPEWARGL